MKVRKFYNRHFLLFELLISIAVAVLISLLLYTTVSIRSIEKWIFFNKSIVFPLIASISTTLLGFLITVMSIIMVFPKSEKIELLKQSKQYGTIFKVYLSAIEYLSVTLVFSAIGFVFDGYLDVIFSFIMLWLLIISSFRIWRCIWILKNMVKIGINDK